ncbi:MAG TPA: phosphate--acyl-ACP acyltransferase, partial [Bryobacterales bacterium]|nr:phosphate--acyl-ACP acyltransferase [Bryobacterales bacterium]
MVTVAVDAMGGDYAPRHEVAGAVEAVRSYDLQVILVGREDVLREELARHGDVSALPIEIVHASERIT